MLLEEGLMYRQIHVTWQKDMMQGGEQCSTGTGVAEKAGPGTFGGRKWVTVNLGAEPV